MGPIMMVSLVIMLWYDNDLKACSPLSSKLLPIFSTNKFLIFQNRFNFEKQFDFKEFVLLLRYDMNRSSNYCSLSLLLFGCKAKSKLSLIDSKQSQIKVKSNGNSYNLIEYFESIESMRL